MSAKDVILTAIYFKGCDKIKNEALELANECLCSKKYVLSIVNKVKKGEINVR